ncbi:hydroxyacid dehydrogenase [Streptomyces sp. PSKA54]|uniref:Hydroxyacid dehydrogenase n=1 Tax=Streptomyces himalayensis subsp. aureolus TaxID=2758039 RepID=A0A7W2D212_9ACTN|nr:hydroxyacid dehydrogenase [Streptomyces himalayensis]MBA4863329.1 hydroxyacid dehydrogenase [Streptomyces himalayensis subsp. aureolus]
MPPTVAALALPDDLRTRLRMVCDVPDLVADDFTRPEVRKALAHTEVLISGWGCPAVDAGLLADAPRLSAVLHAAGSVKPVLAPAVWERGITVSSAALANAGPVADYTVAAIRLAAKRAFRLAADYRGGHHQDLTLSSRTGMLDRTVGIVGASKIGRLVLERLAGTGVRLLVHDPYLGPDEATELGAQSVSLDRLLTGSDIVSLHAPLLPETRHLLDERALGLLRDGAVLINTARGGLVDTDALLTHCADGRIDAVLDVTDPEPLPPGHPLLALPNVLVTPHIAGAMGSEVRLLGEFAVDEAERFASGKPLLGEVRAEDLPRIA